jgi:hypothetical protein
LVANNIITDYNIGVNVQEYEDYFMMGENQKALGVLRCNIYKGLSCLRGLIDVFLPAIGPVYE